MQSSCPSLFDLKWLQQRVSKLDSSFASSQAPHSQSELYSASGCHFAFSLRWSYKVCGGFLSRQTEEYFLPRMLQDLTKQVSLGEENSSVRLFLWSGPWGQDPWGQSHGTTVSHVRKTQPGGDFCHKRGGAQEHGAVGASLSLHDVPPLFRLTPWDGLGGAWEGASCTTLASCSLLGWGSSRGAAQEAEFGGFLIVKLMEDFTWLLFIL